MESGAKTAKGLATALALLGLLHASGCVDERCTRDSECAVGKVCRAGTGRCEAPECVQDSGCGAGLVCEAYACVPGCKVEGDCPAGEECFSHHCYPRRQPTEVTETASSEDVSPIEASCACPAAPAFCGPDLNHRSPTNGLAVCVPGTFPGGVALFFGSVFCSHCQAITQGLLALRQELVGEGESPHLAFVQISDVMVTSEAVSDVEALGDVPVVQDTTALGVWDHYAADWYHVVIVDASGCLSFHAGPLSAEDVAGARHAELLDAWNAAMHPACGSE